MKKTLTLVSTLLLTLIFFCTKMTAQTQGMYDISVSADGFLNRTTTIHRQVRFTARSLPKVEIELGLVALAHNLRKKAAA